MMKRLVIPVPFLFLAGADVGQETTSVAGAQRARNPLAIP